RRSTFSVKLSKELHSIVIQSLSYFRSLRGKKIVRRRLRIDAENLLHLGVDHIQLRRHVCLCSVRNIGHAAVVQNSEVSVQHFLGKRCAHCRISCGVKSYRCRCRRISCCSLESRRVSLIFSFTEVLSSFIPGSCLLTERIQTYGTVCSCLCGCF